MSDTVVLWRPVGPEELKLIEASGMREFPPRLPDQPIFYPVTTKAYADRIAREWNLPRSGSGFVMQFAVRKAFLAGYATEAVGGNDHSEYWIPAEDLSAFNDAIVGGIEIVSRYPAET